MLRKASNLLAAVVILTCACATSPRAMAGDGIEDIVATLRRDSEALGRRMETEPTQNLFHSYMTGLHTVRAGEDPTPLRAGLALLMFGAMATQGGVRFANDLPAGDYVDLVGSTLAALNTTGAHGLVGQFVERLTKAWLADTKANGSVDRFRKFLVLVGIFKIMVPENWLAFAEDLVQPAPSPLTSQQTLSAYLDYNIGLLSREEHVAARIDMHQSEARTLQTLAKALNVSLEAYLKASPSILFNGFHPNRVGAIGEKMCEWALSGKVTKH